MAIPIFIKNILEKLTIHINLQGWFKRENSPVDNRTFNINIDKIEQKVISQVQQNVSTLIDQDGTVIEKLKTPDLLLKSVTSIAPAVKEELESAKKQMNKRIDEAVALLNLHRFDEARSSLLTILGEIKDNPCFLKENARVFNNLGVIYNRPQPEGDYDKAIEYFNAAIGKDPTLIKAKMNVASAQLNKDTKDSLEKGYDFINVLWNTEKTSEISGQILQTLLWAIYKNKGGKAVFEFLTKEGETVKQTIESKGGLLHLVSVLHLEAERFEDALTYAEKAIALSPNEPEFLGIKARALMTRAQHNSLIPSELDIVPKFSDYKDVNEALILFKKAEGIATDQKKGYLIPEIRYGISTCLIWLGKYDESKYNPQRLASENLPESLARQVNILQFAYHMHDRDFETAHKTLKDDPKYLQIPYIEKRRIGKLFLLQGAPEQAKLLFDEIEIEAEQKMDPYFWFDASTVYVLLGNQQESISAANRAKKYSKDKSAEIRKMALSHYNALIFRYSKHGDGEGSETGRLIPSMLEFQSEYPEEKILTAVRALDERGQLTQEIKDVLNPARERYLNIKKIFKEGPIPVYCLEKFFHRSFADLITYRDDPEFTIDFTIPDQSFVEKLKNNFENARTFIFDYLSLLDLAKMGFLGFLEKIGKPILIHESLFQKIQWELLQDEIPELRALWNFLRKSKVIKIVEDKVNTKLKLEKVSDIFDEWLMETIKLAKNNGYTAVTNDLRLLNFLESEDIRSINTTVLLKHWLEKDLIDSKMHSRAIGDLAERLYVFLAYTSDDLFDIVMEDKSKITLRSYHLVSEIFLPGSVSKSFTDVFVKFIALLWRTGSLSEEKVNWIRFITNTIVQIIDKNCAPLQEKQLDYTEREQFLIQTRPFTSSIALIWRTAIQTGTRDDLSELLKVIDEILDKPYFAGTREIIKSGIINRITALTPQ